MKMGDKITINGAEYTVASSTDVDETPEQALAGRRWARTLLERYGVPPITEALLSVEPYSDAELEAMSASQ